MNLPLSQPVITREQAATELLERRAARSNLLDFTQYTFPLYKADPVHCLIADYLTRAVNGEIDRLMIFSPPQTGKSELVSVRLPAYWIGNRPNDPVIITSYGADLAVDKSKQVREVVNSSEYKLLYPEIELKADSKAGNRWKIALPYRGSVLAAGVDGPVTGSGCLLGIIDDPYENWKQAQSATIRNNIWQWWQGTFRTRIWENGIVIIILTRWHEDDIAGRLIKEQPGRWTILRLPMIAETQADRDENDKFLGLPQGKADPLGREPGAVLVPSRFSHEAVDEIRIDVGSVVFAAEYQGVPRPSEGNRVKRAWFAIVGAAPKEARRVRYYDKAATTGAGDYTVGLLMAESDGVYYIEDIVRGQWSVFERQKVMLKTAILDAMKYGKISWHKEKSQRFSDKQPVEHTPEAVAEGLGDEYIIELPGPRIYVEQEGGSGGKDSVDIDINFLSGFAVRKDRPVGDKEVRAEGWIAQAEAGNIKLVQGGWNYEYMNEITTVPNAAHDDQWDATSGAFKKLAQPRSVRLATSSTS